MSCPTCGHTLDCVHTQELPDYYLSIWHCGRCGTLVKSHGGIETDDYRPKLVDRCRTFRGECGLLMWERISWHRLGIAESINLPGERP